MAYNLAFPAFYLNGAMRNMAYYNGTYNGGYLDINPSLIVSGFIDVLADKTEIQTNGYKDYAFYNGCYIRVVNNYGISAVLYNANNVRIGGFGWSSGSDWARLPYFYITLYENTADNNIYAVAIDDGIMISSNGFSKTYFENAPLYTWQPFAQLVGNEGQFRMNLSQIKAEYIGDGNTEQTTSDASYFIFSENSQLRRLTINCGVGDETTIAYCGRNYLTFTRDSTATGAGIFKFYYESGDLAWESSLMTVGNPASFEKFLSIIYDNENEVAALDIITHYGLAPGSNSYYNYNSIALPGEEALHDMWVWLQDNGGIQEDINPYDTGTTDNGGDPGTPRTQDHIGDSPLPTIGGIESAIVTLYRPTSAQLDQIAAFLWSTDVLDNFKKYFNNFADNILSLSVMPFTPENLPVKPFKVGNVQSDIITAVEYVNQRYYDIDMGTVTIDKLWGSYLDYSPYTKCEIYLPFLGLHSLDIDEIMSPCKYDGSMPASQGSTLKLTYRFDILTGLICAKIFVSNEFITNELRYQFTGKCGSNIPLTGQTFGQLVQSMATLGAGLISTVATSGMTAPMVAGAAAVSATVQAQKPTIERIGNISGDVSALASKVPYVVLTSPNKPLLSHQEDFTGFPSYKSGKLSNFTGYTEVIDAHVEDIACTEEERSEILSLLKAGVIL